jgi:nicotinate-nucleotide--dimethylbenzimidazole phosphoribosyltransferase
MVETLAAGRAAASALARSVGCDLVIADFGTRHPRSPHPRLVDARVRAGTGDITAGPAMSRGEAAHAILSGARIAADAARSGADLIALGDMGVGNTTAAACLVAAFTGSGAREVTGPGAGGDADAVDRKARVVAHALNLHRPNERDPIGALASVGGLEHAGLVGVMLGAAGAGCPIILDGVTTNAAALAGVALCPPLREYLIAGHRSPEPGAVIALRHLRLRPLLDLEIRAGEGTGALLAIPIVQGAARALGEMAWLSEVAG